MFFLGGLYFSVVWTFFWTSSKVSFLFLIVFFLFLTFFCLVHVIIFLLFFSC